MTQPLWSPDFSKHTPLICDFIAALNQKYKTNLPTDNYSALHGWSVTNKSDFWSFFWDHFGILGDKGQHVITPISQPPYARYFEDSHISYTENMLRHWQENPNKSAIVYRHQDGADQILTGQDLCDQVSIWEQALRRQGIQKGDVIGIYLPNVPLTDTILMAAANIGAILCSAGMEMGADDLIGRFSAAQPKLLISAPSYQYGDKTIDRSAVLDKIKTQLPSLQHVALFSLPDCHDQDGFLQGLTPQPLVFTRHEFNHPLYILFSSGSTGVPKCFIHGAGGTLLKHLCEYKLQSDIQPGDVSFYHATPSWMMWNWGVSALAAGATQLKHSGNPFYPDAGAQLRFTAAHGCTHHGTAAPVIMGWRDQDLSVIGGLDLSPLRCMLYTGAVLPEQGFDYINNHIKSGVQISGISGGTDIVGCFITGNPLTPVYAGQMAGPCLGVDVQICDDNGQPLNSNATGELTIFDSFPSMPIGFLNDADGARYFSAYYEHFSSHDVRAWRHGDTITRTEQGQIVIVGRSDGTLNQNGVRIGSITLYNQLDQFADQVKAATAVDFIRPDTKQSITILFLTLPDGGLDLPQDLVKSIRSAIKNNVGPYSVPTEIIAAPDILRTKNGKLAEIVTKKILAGQDIPNPKLYGQDLVKFYKNIAKDLQAKYAA